MSRREYQTWRFGIDANFRHRRAVLTRAGQHHRPPLGVREPIVAPGDVQTCRQPLQVPLPRPGKRLVEVVQVEHEPTFGRAEDAEVREVGVAAHLRAKPGRRGRGQIGGHDESRPTVEREGRDEHPPVPDRHQLRDPVGGLFLQEGERIRTVRRGLEDGVARPGDLRTGGLAAGDPLLDRQVRRLGGRPSCAYRRLLVSKNRQPTMPS